MEDFDTVLQDNAVFVIDVSQALDSLYKLKATLQETVDSDKIMKKLALGLAVQTIQLQARHLGNERVEIIPEMKNYDLRTRAARLMATRALIQAIEKITDKLWKGIGAALSNSQDLVAVYRKGTPATVGKKPSKKAK